MKCLNEMNGGGDGAVGAREPTKEKQMEERRLCVDGREREKVARNVALVLRLGWGCEMCLCMMDVGHELCCCSVGGYHR